jgi:hypothetical protein
MHSTSSSMIHVGGYGPPQGGGGGYGPPPGGAPPGGYGGAPPGGYGGPPQSGPPPGPFGGPSPGGFHAPPPNKGNKGLLIGLIAGGGVLLLVAIVVAAIFVVKGRGTEEVSDGKGGTVTLPAKLSSKAYNHVPSGCELLVRVDAAQAIALPSVQKHIVPELDALKDATTTDPDAKKMQEVLSKAGIDPKTDIKDVVLCGTGVGGPKSGEKFVFILGGELRPEAVVPAIREVDSAKVTVIDIDGRKVAQGSGSRGDSFLMGQAADGAVVFASDRTLFESAVKDSKIYESEYGLPVNTEAAFVVGSALIEKAGAEAGRGNPFTRDINSVTKVAGTLGLTNPAGQVRITAKTPADAKKINTSINSLLPLLKRSAAREKSQAGELEALAAAKTKVDGSDVIIDLPWTAAGVEQAAQKLAEELKRSRQRGGVSL